jgi:hypothetical protein
MIFAEVLNVDHERKRGEVNELVKEQYIYTHIYTHIIYNVCVYTHTRTHTYIFILRLLPGCLCQKIGKREEREFKIPHKLPFTSREEG